MNMGMRQLPTFGTSPSFGITPTFGFVRYPLLQGSLYWKISLPLGRIISKIPGLYVEKL
jgi:hypothetical protein